MSAGGEVGFTRDEMGPPTPDLFRRLRGVRISSPHVLATGGLTPWHLQVCLGAPSCCACLACG